MLTLTTHPLQRLKVLPNSAKNCQVCFFLYRAYYTWLGVKECFNIVTGHLNNKFMLIAFLFFFLFLTLLGCPFISKYPSPVSIHNALYKQILQMKSLSKHIFIYLHFNLCHMTFFISSGRTLDFTIDLSKMPIIGRKFIYPESYRHIPFDERDGEGKASSNGSAVSLSRKPSNNQDLDSVWRRPQASQV